MVVTADVQESIRQILYDEWNLHGPLSKGTLGADAFNTGITAAARSYPSIEVLPVTDRPLVLSVNWWQMDALVHIHVWARPRTTEKKALAKAKSDRRYLLQEVKRILHLKCIELVDIDWTWPETEINADQYHGLDADISESTQSTAPDSRGLFPILHTILPLKARRWHNKHTGGVAVNRNA